MTQITSVEKDVQILDKRAQAFQSSVQTLYRHHEQERRSLNNEHKDLYFVSDESWYLICIITTLILQMVVHFILL